METTSTISVLKLAEAHGWKNYVKILQHCAQSAIRKCILEHWADGAICKQHRILQTILIGKLALEPLTRAAASFVYIHCYGLLAC